MYFSILKFDLHHCANLWFQEKYLFTSQGDIWRVAVYKLFIMHMQAASANYHVWLTLYSLGLSFWLKNNKHTLLFKT